MNYGYPPNGYPPDSNYVESSQYLPQLETDPRQYHILPLPFHNNHHATHSDGLTHTLPSIHAPQFFHNNHFQWLGMGQQQQVYNDGYYDASMNTAYQDNSYGMNHEWTLLHPSLWHLWGQHYDNPQGAAIMPQDAAMGTVINVQPQQQILSQPAQKEPIQPTLDKAKAKQLDKELKENEQAIKKTRNDLNESHMKQIRMPGHPTQDQYAAMEKERERCRTRLEDLNAQRAELIQQREYVTTGDPKVESAFQKKKTLNDGVASQPQHQGLTVHHKFLQPLIKQHRPEEVSYDTDE